jgi:hypothetical protein
VNEDIEDQLEKCKADMRTLEQQMRELKKKAEV